MTTSPFELGPFAPIGVPFFLLMAYATYRGFRFREFRLRGESGWHKAQPNSFDYWIGTVTNLMLLASFAFVMVMRK
jgi:hypothetical protein